MSQEKNVLIVIDEASALLDQEENMRFHRFRMALLLKKDDLAAHGIIFALVDTNSRITNVAPPAVFDTSSRPWKSDFLLLPPFWEINPPLSLDSIKPSVNVKAQLTHGRPLWGAHSDLDSEALIGFGRQKLLGGAFRKLVTGTQPNERAASLAICSVLVDLSVNPVVTLASDLIASHMVLLLQGA